MTVHIAAYQKKIRFVVRPIAKANEITGLRQKKRKKGCESGVKCVFLLAIFLRTNVRYPLPLGI